MIKVISSFRNRINEASINRVREHFLDGDVIGIVSAFRNERTPQENKAEDRHMINILRQVSKNMHWGFNRGIGHWVEDASEPGKEGKPVDENSAIIYGKPDDLDLMKEMLLGFCKKYNQEGFMLCYDGKAYYVDKTGTEYPAGTFNGSLKSLGDAYTSLYNRKRHFIDSKYRTKWSFEFAQLESYRPIATRFNSFADKMGYKTTKNLLERYGDQIFDRIKMPSRWPEEY